jgi:hypothetical protein
MLMREQPMIAPCPSAKSAIRGIALCVLLFTLVVSGCGKGAPKRGSVSGSVNFRGQPLEAGLVIFQVGDDIGNAMVVDGLFNGTDIPVGKAKVLFQSTTPPPDANGKYRPAIQLPAVYGDPTTTPHEVDIKKGKNKPFEFNLE